MADGFALTGRPYKEYSQSDVIDATQRMTEAANIQLYRYRGMDY